MEDFFIRNMFMGFEQNLKFLLVERHPFGRVVRFFSSRAKFREFDMYSIFFQAKMLGGCECCKSLNHFTI